MSEQIQKIAQDVRAGNPRVLARVLSEVENRGPQAAALLAELFEGSTKARRIGITGAPGAGKSTLVDQIARELRNRGLTVAIVAVDPTSPFSGGAILGDRVRMLSHHADPGVFIRSMATRGALGGLAPAVADTISVLEASGRDVVIVETVGVGQAEVDVVQLAEVVAVILTPSTGDDIQAAKAGIMEIADVFAINKADQPGVERLEQQIRAMLSLLPAGQPHPPIVRTVATAGDGIADLVDTLLHTSRGPASVVNYWRRRLLDAIAAGIVGELSGGALSDDNLNRAAEDVASGKLNPYDFVRQVVEQTIQGRAK